MSDTENKGRPPLADRRPNPRRKVLFGAAALSIIRHDAMACQVRDLSDNGAKISVASTAILPHDFYLIIHRSQRAYRAKAVWRRGDEAGLAFIDAIDLTLDLPPGLHYLRHAWQNAGRDHLTWR